MSTPSAGKRTTTEEFVQLPEYESTPTLPRESGYTTEERNELREEYGFLRTYFKTRPDRYRNLQSWLDQGRYGVVYDSFLARNARYALLTGMVFFVIGVVLGSLLASRGVFDPLAWPGGSGAPDALSPLVTYKAWIAGGATASTVAALSGLTVWYALYWSPKFAVTIRRQKIDYTLPHAIVFMYAMSHGGMTLFEVIKQTAAADDAYGEVAMEFDMVVRDVELYGNDLITAIRNARNTTPSENFEQFLDDMLSALDSGADMPSFFSEQSDTYLDRSKEEQEGFLETLGVMSEVFVSVLVAGPLFFVVLMIIISLLDGGGTLLLLFTFVYVIFPAGLVAFIAIVAALSEPYKEYRTQLDVPDDRTDDGRSSGETLDEWVNDHERERDRLTEEAADLSEEAARLEDERDLAPARDLLVALDADEVGRLLDALAADEGERALTDGVADEIHRLLAELAAAEFDRHLAAVDAREADKHLAELDAADVDRRLAELDAADVEDRAKALESDEIDRILRRLDADDLERPLATVEAETLDDFLSVVAADGFAPLLTDRSADTIDVLPEPVDAGMFDRLLVGVTATAVDRYLTQGMTALTEHTLTHLDPEIADDLLDALLAADFEDILAGFDSGTADGLLAELESAAALEAAIAALESAATAARTGADAHQQKLTTHRNYDGERRWRRWRQFARQPFESVQANPMHSLFITVPVAVLFVIGMVLTNAAELSTNAMFSDPFTTTTRLIVLPFLIVLAPIGIFYEIRRAREKRMIENFPATLNILASANNMGIPLTDALELVSRWSSSLYAAEFRKVRNDIEWNSDTSGALLAFANRLRVPSISRTVKLVAEGSRSSGDLGRILSVAANDTRERYRIVRRRSQIMSGYVVVVILGALIYLGVVSLLEWSFLAPIEKLQLEGITDATGTSRGLPASFSNIPTDTYRALLFHSVLIQSAGSGLIAGQLSDGTVLSGIKYAVGLVVLSLLVFWIVIG